MHAVYGVAAQKTVLNVSKIRLRVFFARALYPAPLFLKALERQKRHGCRWFQAEASLLLQTCSPKMNKDVHFWVRMAVKLTRSEICASHKSRRQNAQGWAGNKSETSFGTKLVLYRCTWTYIGREVHGCTTVQRPIPSKT